MTDPLSLIPKEAFVASRTGKFESKLTFEQRCTILALVVSKVARPVVAVAFGVDRRTVTHICNESSPHYKNVRGEMKKLGHAEFVKQHISEADANAVMEAVTRVQADQPDPHAGPSARRSSHAGIQTVKPEQCDYSHRLEIKFWPEPSGGWKYRDLDSKTDPDAWLHNGEESLLSSKACFEAAQANLTDD